MSRVLLSFGTERIWAAHFDGTQKAGRRRPILHGSVEVRKGRSGRWVAASSVAGLSPLPAPHNELAINEMDIVADASLLAPFDASAAEPSQQDTAVDSEAKRANPPH